MESIQNVLSVLGIMVCSYTIAHLLAPVIKKHDDNPAPPFYVKILLVLCCVFYAGSAVVGLLDQLLWSKPHIESAAAEARKSSNTLIAIKDREIRDLKARLALYESVPE